MPPLPWVTSGGITVKNIGIKQLWKTIWNYLIKVIMYTYNIEIPFLGMYLETYTLINRETYTEYFRIAPNWNPPKCPSTQEWIIKL